MGASQEAGSMDTYLRFARPALTERKSLSSPQDAASLPAVVAATPCSAWFRVKTVRFTPRSAMGTLLSDDATTTLEITPAAYSAIHLL